VTGANEHTTVVIRYSRQDVLRILRIHANQLAAWERVGLILQGDTYSFQDLVQLRKLRDLSRRVSGPLEEGATRLSAARIQASVHAMRTVSGVINPLLEASAVRTGSRLAFRLRGAMVDPIARQFVFDFDSPQPGQLAEVGDTPAAQAARDARIGNLFLEAVQNEEQAKTNDAIALYEDILALNEGHAPACINLGTIFYNQRKFLQAERLYRRATVSDPNYALAYFDLGNVLDELQRLPEAIEAYRRAIRLVPRYADAHYNLALAFERRGEHRRALRHWNSYIKLDPIGPWANHARGQARKIIDREKLTIVYRSSPLRRDLSCRQLSTSPMLHYPPLPR
jgi:tetratricopeptide (TPR) repeat protein